MIFLVCILVVVGILPSGDSEILSRSTNAIEKYNWPDVRNELLPEERTFHKLKKLKKKMMLLCLLGLGGGNGRSYRESDANGRFFFPNIQQVANLQVNSDDTDDDHDGDDNDDGSDPIGSGSSSCHSLLSGGGGFPGLSSFPSHPLLNGLLQGIGGNSPATDNRRRRRIDRYVVRPIRRQTTNLLYQLFK